MSVNHLDIKDIPPIGIGTFSVPHNMLKSIIKKGIHLGYVLIDTAFKYKNETIIGEILDDLGVDRRKILIQTKAGPELLVGRLRYFKLDKISVKKAINRACKRLKTNYIDIFLLHCPFKGYEKSFIKLNDCKKEGMVRYIGVCNISYDQLVDLHKRTGLYPDIVQIELHPYFTNKKLCEFCLSHNIIVEARSPFAHGDAFKAWSTESLLQELSKKYTKSITQIILKWIIQQGVVALPRTKDVNHLASNMESLTFNMLDDEIEVINSMNQNMSFGFVSSTSMRYSR